MDEVATRDHRSSYHRPIHRYVRDPRFKVDGIRGPVHLPVMILVHVVVPTVAYDRGVPHDYLPDLNCGVDYNSGSLFRVSGGQIQHSSDI
jgi:hypothetical protein